MGHILPITRAVLAIAFSYLIGSIPMGLIVARVAKGIDIREHGSGNIGLTNVIRTLGWGPGLVTGILDFFKGYLPLFFALRSFSPDDFGSVAAVYETIIIMVALFLILGNLFPVYLMFKGGKGVATGLGVVSALLGVYIFIPLAVFGLFLFLFRFVSLASIVGAIATPLTVLLLSSRMSFTADSATASGLLVAFTSAVALLIIWRHRSNVARIIAGTEPRVSKPKELSRKPPAEVSPELAKLRAKAEMKSTAEPPDTPDGDAQADEEPHE